MNQEVSPKFKYFLYARKSSEQEDRQVASIDSQIDFLKELAEREHLQIIEILTESKSAKAPGREIFNEMIARIERGDAQGILCWKIDRLARNPVDGGKIQWLLQNNVIKQIRSFERSYYPSDNVLLISVELGMANQYIRDLAFNSQRGIKTKAATGWFPAPAPIGYLNVTDNETGTKIIASDPVRFPLIKKMIELVLTGEYSPPKVVKKANEEWGFRMPSGGPLGRSTFYKVLTEPFYYGKYKYPKNSDTWYDGKHPAMITEDQYDRIQDILGRKGKPRPKEHEFAFTGMIRCGECGCMITAEEKTKHQQNGNTHHYTYYHCSKRKGPCSQKCIEIKDLEKQISEKLEEIKIPKEFYDWSLIWIKAENGKESIDRNTILESQQKTYEASVKKIDRLVDLRISGTISEEEFDNKRNELMKEKARLQTLLKTTDQRIDTWIETIEKILKFAQHAHEVFPEGKLLAKKTVLAALGSNLVLKDKILDIDLTKSLLPLQKVASSIRTQTERLEPLTIPANKRALEESYAKSTSWLRDLDSNLTS